MLLFLCAVEQAEARWLLQEEEGEVLGLKQPSTSNQPASSIQIVDNATLQSSRRRERAGHWLLLSCHWLLSDKQMLLSGRSEINSVLF
jgi:hypothetical protein